jgi:hypothetical protein
MPRKVRRVDEDLSRGVGDGRLRWRGIKKLVEVIAIDDRKNLGLLGNEIGIIKFDSDWVVQRYR